MLPVPPDVLRAYETALDRMGIDANRAPHYVKWLRFYLDFCGKYRLAPVLVSTVPRFLDKLRQKNQEEWKCRQADEAVAIYFRLVALDGSEKPPTKERKQDAMVDPRVRGRVSHGYRSEPRPAESPRWPMGGGRVEHSVAEPEGSFDVERAEAVRSDRVRLNDQSQSPLQNGRSESVGKAAQGVAAVARKNADTAPAEGLPANWPDVYTRLRAAIMVRHYSPKTLKSYSAWARKFQGFVRNKSPSAVTVEDAKAFFSFLAVEKNISASSQNLAFNALLFLYRHVLGRDFGKVEGVVRAKKRPYIPVVLSREEVERLIAHLPLPCDRVAKLLYGCGLRLFECLKLRVQDVDFDMGMLTVHDGKGKKDRTLPLPRAMLPELRAQLDDVIRVHDADLACGFDGTFLPNRLEQKYKSAAKELAWQWFFPATKLTLVPGDREYRRYHLHETVVQKAIKRAVWQAKIAKRASAHTLRHSYASHLLQANYDIRTIQKLLGHSDVRTTMIYTHTVPSTTLKEAKSPLDL